MMLQNWLNLEKYSNLLYGDLFTCVCLLVHNQSQILNLYIFTEMKFTDVKSKLSYIHEDQ